MCVGPGVVGSAAAFDSDATPDRDGSTVAWTECPSDEQPDKQCALFPVPVDYAHPAGRKIRIALARIPATGAPDEYLGTLFWDAGGPGGPSTQMVDTFVQRLSPEVRARFDFVAFDPRGIGGSRPALTDCGQPWLSRPPRKETPNWQAVQRKSADELAADNRTCLGGNERIAPWMGTVNVARDLNRMRKAVGDRKLTFWATSYGTRIGYVYALRYPVRAMVLDGNIDPSTGFVGMPRIGGTSQDSALDFMANNYRVGYDAIMATAKSLATDPIRLPDGTLFSRWNWLDMVGDSIPFPESWPQVADWSTAIERARGDGADAAGIRQELQDTKSRPNGNEGAGFSTVNCLDYAGRLSAARQVDLARVNGAEYPVFGPSLTLTYGMGCAGLKGLTPDPVPLVTTAAQREILADVPVVVANATHDGATPMAWAKDMAVAFGDRPIIRYRSGQHVIWGGVDSACVNEPIDRFVIRRIEPQHGRVCPFVPPKPAPTGSALSFPSPTSP